MRKIFLLTAFTCLFTVFCHAQKKYEMVVEKTDGSNIIVNTEDIIRTYFRERTGGGNNEGGIGDTSQAYLTCPDSNHPHMIDLGLPSGTKWACCNVGAPLPETVGGYYAWGETQEKSVYNSVNYQYATGVDDDGDGWYDDHHSDTDAYGVWQYLGSDIAGTQYDVAHVKWGGTWRMPSDDQIGELLKWCNVKWTSRNGIKGCLFTSYKSGGTIFLPAAGFHRGSGLYYAGSDGYYWSSAQSPSYAYKAYYLYFDSSHAGSSDSKDRNYGQSVRPVISGVPLSLSAIELTKGKKGTVNILSGNGNYTVQTSDPAVATATIDNNTVVISGVGDGIATITVTNTQNKWFATISVIVKYNSCPDDHHPHLIDLGLPSGTKWACCNVDTDHPENQSPTNYGGYYAWGETETKSMYSEETYKHYQNGNYVSLGSDIAGTEYDVAHVKWGGAWQMPSEDQIKELIDKCNYEWIWVKGVFGGWFISKINGVSIFMPFAGCNYDSNFCRAGSSGYYWSSTQDPSGAYYAYDLYFGSGHTYWSSYNRYNGQSVRPVVRK